MSISSSQMDLWMRGYLTPFLPSLCSFNLLSIVFLFKNKIYGVLYLLSLGGMCESGRTGQDAILTDSWLRGRKA